MAKNGDSHMLGLSDFDSIKGPNVTSI